MHPVGEIEDPQHGHIRRCGILVSPDRGVESTLSKLRFAFWHRIAVDGVVFYHIKCLGDQAVGSRQMIGPYEIEIVCRGVILGNLAEPAALQKSHR